MLAHHDDAPIEARDDDVHLIHWPLEADVRRQLAARDLPRLLVVDPDAEPPAVTDALEDWLREPIDPEELEVRRTQLQQRYAAWLRRGDPCS